MSKQNNLSKAKIFSFASCAWLLACSLDAMPNIGSACTTHSDCRKGAHCVPNQSESGPTGFVDGYCTEFNCSQDQPCSDSDKCIQFGTPSFSACLAPCEKHDDCRVGYQCTSQGVCLPGCAERSCPENMKCNEDKLCIDGSIRPLHSKW